MVKNISPHVQIYKFPVTAISSIATRLSGLYLSGVFISTGLINLTNKDKYFIDKYNNLNSNLKKIINYSVIIPFNYHTLSGIRHFIWDKYPSYFLNNKNVSTSSYILFGSTVFYSALLEYYFLK